MAKSKRRPRAKHKIDPELSGGLVPFPVEPVKPDVFVEVPQGQQLIRRTALTRSTLFTAELEAVIDLIARDRVYRAMRALQPRYLPAPEPKRIEPYPPE